jgi:hypothetical protein
LTMLFIGAVITLEAWPVFNIFSAQTFGRPISVLGWISIVLCFVLVFAINILALLLPMQIGLKRLSAREV